MSDIPTVDDLGPMGVCVFYRAQGLPRFTHVNSTHRWFGKGLDEGDLTRGVVVYGWIPGSESNNLGIFLNQEVSVSNEQMVIKRRIRVDEN